MPESNVGYARLEDGQVAPGTNPQMPVEASGMPEMLTTVGVLASLGCFLSLLTLILNVIIAIFMDIHPSYYYNYYGGVNFETTPGIWFGMPNGVLCGITLAYSVRMCRGDFSSYLKVTGILVSVFFGIMSAMGITACGIATAISYESTYHNGTWALFLSVSVFSALAIVVDLTLCVLLAKIVSMPSGCCGRSNGPDTQVYPPNAQATMIRQTQYAQTQPFPTEVAMPVQQTAAGQRL